MLSLMGTQPICRQLLDKKAHANCMDPDKPVLHTAVSARDLETVQLLVDAGIGTETDTEDGTPLIVAAQNSDADIMRYLLEKGADVNHANTRGETALFLAAENSHVDVVRILLEKGADVNAAEHTNSRRPLHVAYDSEEITEMLLDRHADINALSTNGSAFVLGLASRLP